MSEPMQPLLSLAAASFIPVPAYLGLWCASIDSYRRFNRECAACCLGLPRQTYSLMDELLKSVSYRIETAASHVAHASIRAVAIATQARKQTPDRRVLRVSLPGERRAEPQSDRRYGAGQRAA